MLFMFPGQGSQKIGMGKDIYDNFSEARDVFNEVDDALAFRLSDLIFNGTEEELSQTQYTQPALMCVSIAYLRVLQKIAGVKITDAKFLAGHSLGEYTALCAANVLSLRDTATLLSIRGKAMACSCPSQGSMAAIIGLSIEQVSDIVSHYNNTVDIANDNSPGQIVISGMKDDVLKAAVDAKTAGAKMAVELNVSGPFHSKYMKFAQDFLSTVIDQIAFHNATIPIITNYTAQSQNTNFQETLIQQMTNRVRWRESMLFAHDSGVHTFIEIGNGKVLSGLIRRIIPDAKTININSIDSIEAFTKETIPSNC